MLALEFLGAVLTHDFDARSGEHTHVFERDILGCGDDRDALTDLGTDARVVRTDGFRRHSRSLPAVL